MHKANLCRHEEDESFQRQDTGQYHDRGEETDGLVAFKRTQNTHTLKADRTDGQFVVIICSTGENDKHC